jgi:DNA processing protein
MTRATADSETRAILLLARACLAAKGVSLWQVSAVAQRVGSARAVLDGAFEPGTEFELAVRAAARAFASRLPDAEAEVECELAGWAERGLRVTTVMDGDYPLNLRWVYDRPPFLFYRGELKQLEDAYALAVVGTRNPTEGGRKRARRMARLLAERHVTVLSGLAAGIDTEAHRATLEAGGRTVAVLGHGFDHL